MGVFVESSLSFPTQVHAKLFSTAKHLLIYVKEFIILTVHGLFVVHFFSWTIVQYCSLRNFKSDNRNQFQINLELQ